MARDPAATLYHGTTLTAQGVCALLCSKTGPASGSRSQQGATFQPDLHKKGDVKWPSGKMSFSYIMKEGAATNFIKFSLWSNKQKKLVLFQALGVYFPSTVSLGVQRKQHR